MINIETGTVVRLVAVVLLLTAGVGTAAAATVSITTLQPQQVTKTSAELRGEVTDWQGHSGGQVGFQYRKQGSDSWQTVWVASSTSATRYTVIVDDLAKGTTYEYRAVAKAGGDTYYGPTVTVTTKGSANDGGSNDGGSNSGPIQKLVQAINGIPGKIQDVIFNPFRTLAATAIDALTVVLTWYPQVHPNPHVEEIHRLTLAVTFALSTLAVVVTGILFQIGPVLGVSYRQARMILPRLFLALVFATVSPILLQYTVDFADVLTQVFKPETPNFMSVWQVSAELAIIAVVEAGILLAVGVIFVIRDVYLLFAAAISPLIALAWVFPQSKRYADTFIGAWWAALMIGPLDMLVLRLALSLVNPAVGIPNWLLSIGALTLLAAVPYLVFTASQAMVGEASILARSGVDMMQRKMVKYRYRRRREEMLSDSDDRQRHPRSRRGRREGPRKRSGRNKFQDIINDGGDQQ